LSSTIPIPITLFLGESYQSWFGTYCRPYVLNLA
jgi:hypothetical protein